MALPSCVHRWIKSGQCQWLIFSGCSQSLEFPLVLQHWMVGDVAGIWPVFTMLYVSKVSFRNKRRKKNREGTGWRMENVIKVDVVVVFVYIILCPFLLLVYISFHRYVCMWCCRGIVCICDGVGAVCTSEGELQWRVQVTGDGHAAERPRQQAVSGWPLPAQTAAGQCCYHSVGHSQQFVWCLFSSILLVVFQWCQVHGIYLVWTNPILTFVTV